MASVMRRTTTTGATDNRAERGVQSSKAAFKAAAQRFKALRAFKRFAPSDAPKGQQLTAQGIALGFCVGVVFFALKVQKLLPLQGGLPLASYNPGRSFPASL